MLNKCCNGNPTCTCTSYYAFTISNELFHWEMKLKQSLWIETLVAEEGLANGAEVEFPDGHVELSASERRRFHLEVLVPGEEVILPHLLVDLDRPDSAPHNGLKIKALKTRS